MPESAVRIALVFPSLLGTYGDGGNASVLAQRLRWRGIDADVIDVGVDDAVPEQADLYVLGGGEDTAQTLAVSRLSDGVLARAVAADKTVFAVCAGFQNDSAFTTTSSSQRGRHQRLPDSTFAPICRVAR